MERKNNRTYTKEEKGLYLEDVKKWINSCMSSTNNNFEINDIKELRAS